MALRKGVGAALAGVTAATAIQYRRVTQQATEASPKDRLSVFSSNTPPKSKQRVVVIGAGVVGVSTAYKLAQRGHEVVVLVRA